MKFASFSRYTPGLSICVIVALAARFLADHFTAPTMLFALLLGLSLHFLSEDDRLLPGVAFVGSDLLKLGVALLGLRITLADIASLGFTLAGLVVACVIFTIGIGVLLSFLFGRRVKFGLLTGGAVGICGASAALAISAVLPASETKERDTAFTVVAVTACSTIAMVAYPILAEYAGFDERITGILLGITIHDVAQVVGAGFSVSDNAGEVATLVKLFRVTLLVPVIFLITFVYRNSTDNKGKASIPWFVYGFVISVLVNSLNLLPAVLHDFISALSGWLLVAGIVGIGIKTSLKSLLSIGPTALTVVILETILLLALGFGLLHFSQPFLAG